MHWTYVDEKVPPRTGYYLVVVRLGSKLGNYAFITEWNQESKSFSYDDTARKHNNPTRVYAWCEVPTPPMDKRQLRNKQEKQL